MNTQPTSKHDWKGLLGSAVLGVALALLLGLMTWLQNNGLEWVNLLLWSAFAIPTFVVLFRSNR